ncbi:MAG: zinc ABC transporter substrate-binding protein [Candidatus Omnitrophica bacterium]|nr:zinc ABC transporter substrate-binding protein [Candidatus Omnitrophota bacterium]
MIKNVRIISVLVLSLALLFTTAAMAVEEGKTIRVVASFYPIYIMARNVLKDVPGVTITNLTATAAGCLHDYTLTTADMKKLTDADIFIANGAGMESFLDRIVVQYPWIKIFQLSSVVPLIAGAGQDNYNPHVWVSVKNAIMEVQNLGVVMAQADPLHAELYRRNTGEYVVRLEALRLKMHAGLERYRGTKIITFHEAFPYFAQEFGLDIAAVVEREPGSEPGARELAETVDIVRKAGIRALFSEPQYPALAAQTIARETGATVYQLDPSVSGPDDMDAYLQIMEKNLEVLKNAFSK